MSSYVQNSCAVLAGVRTRRDERRHIRRRLRARSLAAARLFARASTRWLRRPGERVSSSPQCSAVAFARRVHAADDAQRRHGQQERPSLVGRERGREGSRFHSLLIVWVPKTVSPYATWEYSWIRPPSLSLRTIRIPVISN
jgi:hypothetical protein